MLMLRMSPSPSVRCATLLRARCPFAGAYTPQTGGDKWFHKGEGCSKWVHVTCVRTALEDPESDYHELYKGKHPVK